MTPIIPVVHRFRREWYSEINFSKQIWVSYQFQKEKSTFLNLVHVHHMRVFIFWHSAWQLFSKRSLITPFLMAFQMCHYLKEILGPFFFRVYDPHPARTTSINSREFVCTQAYHVSILTWAYAEPCRRYGDNDRIVVTLNIFNRREIAS